MITKQKVVLFVILIFLYSACGGSSDKNALKYEDVAVNVTIENISTSAGIPQTFVYTIPDTQGPYTDATIDLEKTLKAADFTVTPRP